MTPDFEETDILDAEVWAAPDRLSEDECLDQIGCDRGWPSRWNREGDQ